MELLTWLMDVILHLDRHLALLMADYGQWVYLILFAIIFSETGFVVTPFLPGDSLLFVAGALAALGETAAGGGLNIWALTLLLSTAAIFGNMVNYQIGRFFGARVFQWENSRFFNRNAFLKTQDFYARHGGKTLIISRFLPLFRTFAPFVAGIGSMTYGSFFFYNACGALAWVFLLCFSGYWFGNLPWVSERLSLIVVGIVFVSLLPVLLVWAKQKMAARGKVKHHE